MNISFEGIIKKTAFRRAPSSRIHAAYSVTNITFIKVLPSFNAISGKEDGRTGVI
jgi:hypothetical protein